MPIGPNGEKRPVSTNSAAVMAAKILTGLAEEQYVGEGKPEAAEQIAARNFKEAETE